MIERFLKYLFFTLVILHLLVLGGTAYKTYNAVYDARPISESMRAFEIKQGQTLSQLLEDLYESNMAPAPVFMRLALASEKKKLVIKKGHYQLPESSSPRDLLSIFEEGRVILHKITIPEGLDRWQLATLLGESRWGDEATFSQLISDPTLITHLDPHATSLEGYLFPETYMFPEETTAEEVVTAMVKQFETRTRSLRTQLTTRGLTLGELVTLASLVEKESSLPEERPRIAGVFQNRLNRGMLLQCDPTIIYSLKLDERYRGRIYRSDIRYKHPYNTYTTKGLPPGPIAGPGLGSMEAALDPEETPFLYFVAKKDGSHYFSRTLREHNRAVRKYLRN